MSKNKNIWHKHIWSLVAMVLFLASACTKPLIPPKERSLAEARQKVLALFSQLDGFEMEKQREVGLLGRAAVRMEAHWNHAGQMRRGIIYVVDHPKLFNVIHYTAPDDNNLFEAGYPAFQTMLKDLEIMDGVGTLTVTEHEGHKLMRSPDLQLAIRYPNDWVYSLDELNRAVVFSGPREEPTWLTTVSFSIIDKWADSSS